MVRVGNNPFRGVRNTYETRETTVVVLIFIPHFEGYFAERWSVVRLCLASILKHTDRPFDLMVVDNGSCPPVVDWLVQLRKSGIIQHLILNWRNLYLADALNMAFRAAPGRYVAYSDDDVFFYPEWLSAHLAILETFPRVAFVSGFAADGDDCHDAVPRLAGDLNIRCESTAIPVEWSRRYCESFGKNLEEFLRQPDVRDCNNYLLQKDGLRAYAGARDQNYVFRKSLLDELPPMVRGDFGRVAVALNWHRTANQMGYMRLSTAEITAFHMGNTLGDQWRAEAGAFGIPLDGDLADVRTRLNRPRGVLTIPWVQKGLKYVARRLLAWIT